MTRMTKTQLVDENIRLRASYEALEQRLADALARLATPTPVAKAAVTRIPGMTKFLRNGVEVAPSKAQLAYWQNRLAQTA